MADLAAYLLVAVAALTLGRLTTVTAILALATSAAVTRTRPRWLWLYCSPVIALGGYNVFLRMAAGLH